MEFTFTPTDQQQIEIPYFEDARADFAPYYTSHGHGKKTQSAQSDVITELAKLGAGGILFKPGYFGPEPKRHGYVIEFQYGGGRGMIRVAGLPIKNESDKKIEAVQVQALLNVRDWLKSAVTTRVFSPGSDVLIPFMIVAHTNGKDYTVADYIHSRGSLPQLNSGPSAPVMQGDIIEGIGR